MLVLDYPETLLTLFDYDHFLSAGLGILLNLIVVVGLNLPPCRTLGNYRWFLLAHTLNDLVSAITIFLLELRFDYNFNTFIMLIDGPGTALGRAVGLILFAIFTASYMLNITLLGVSFIYRYLKICKKHLLNMILNQSKYVIAIVIVIFTPVTLITVVSMYVYTYSHKFSISDETDTYHTTVLNVENITSPSFIIAGSMFIGLASIYAESSGKVDESAHKENTKDVDLGSTTSVSYACSHFQPTGNGYDLRHNCWVRSSMGYVDYVDDIRLASHAQCNHFAGVYRTATDNP
ncbi:hypothetical protein QR680_015478 [Steinernema hermaphroditum]|uniref:Uncharacterized protein n=1 Tax=Steinernema hermaphroditum TaxID=289476 RepID=A0AA39H8W2_9BILA|nr:hypothetical protein QR680_015478 [Steinernema hermaphroditum]